jgi:hypothetical protein
MTIVVIPAGAHCRQLKLFFSLEGLHNQMRRCRIIQFALCIPFGEKPYGGFCLLPRVALPLTLG